MNLLGWLFGGGVQTIPVAERAGTNAATNTIVRYDGQYPSTNGIPYLWSPMLRQSNSVAGSEGFSPTAALALVVPPDRYLPPKGINSTNVRGGIIQAAGARNYAKVPAILQGGSG